MDDEKTSGFDSSGDQGEAARYVGGRDSFLDTLDLTGLFATDVTHSGSFDLQALPLTALGKLINALPIPAMILDRAGHITFANQSCGKIGPGSGKTQGQAFSGLFLDPISAKEALSVLEEVFVTRKGAVSQADVQIDRVRISGRLHFRSVRMGQDRRVLLLVQDVTAEKKQLWENQLHEEELLRSRHELEKSVEERTAALNTIRERLRKEITRRGQSEKTIQAEREFVDTILESLSHPFYIIDADDYTVKKANSAAIAAGIGERSTCYSVTHSGTHPCDGLDHPCPLEEVKKTRRPVVVEHVHYDGEGNAKNVDVYAYPILDSEGSVKQVIEYCLDVTDRKRAEQLLLRSERLKAVGELASGVAHNFNNLLQIVLSSAQFALTRLVSGDVSGAIRDLEQIVESSHLGSQTVKQLQDFARIRTENGVRNGRVFDLANVARNAIQMSRPWWQTKPERVGSKITLKSDLQTGCTVQGQEADLFDVLINLIKNSSEALPDGGEISVSSFVEADKVVVRVRDNGIGISRDDLGKVFEPFHTTKGPQAAGMGLACSLGIVRRYSGEISVESIEGRGSVFTVTLPLSRSPKDAARTEIKEEVVSPLRLLIVDDVEAIVAVLWDGLSELGHTVLTATSGKQGIEIFKVTPVDLVICDLGMPEMNGWQVASTMKSICSEKGISKTPFVLITGWGGQVAEDKMAAESGVDAIIEKPIDLLALMEVIGELAPKSSNPVATIQSKSHSEKRQNQP